MADATRYPMGNEPLQIYQDEYYANENSASIMNHHNTNNNNHHMMSAPMMHQQHQQPPHMRKQLQSSNMNLVFNPPMSNTVNPSPLKPLATQQHHHLQPHPALNAPAGALRPAHGNRLNTVSMAPPPPAARLPTDCIQKKPFQSQFKPMAQKPGSIDLFYGKENVHPIMYSTPQTPNMPMSIENYYHHQQQQQQQQPHTPSSLGKRGLMEAAHIKDERSAKKQKFEDAVLPPHDSFPPIVDDGSKPAHSYAQLIGMSILRSPNRRLTLSQIYKWISDNFSFYNPNDAGWQNSIRHNLSLHKNFQKIERSKDDPGKGNYWAIEPGTEFQFIKEKTPRKGASASENLPPMSTRLEPPPTMIIPSAVVPPTPSPPTILSSTTPATSSSIAARGPILPSIPELASDIPSMSRNINATPNTSNCLPPLPAPQNMRPVPSAMEPSSDATIPVEDSPSKNLHDSLHGEASLFSPVQAAMHSSPPIQRHSESRSGTPPPPMRVPASSIGRSTKRKYPAGEDSGYISSLESSVMRPNNQKSTNNRLTSETDRPRKRGRAEDEIARLRASSFDSPTQQGSRSWSNGFAPMSSSPLRNDHASRNEPRQMLPPLTPAVKLHSNQKPPPSVSPNTNLRIHRDRVSRLLQSPLRSGTGAYAGSPSALAAIAAAPWSPAFNLDENQYDRQDTPQRHGQFDMFQDMNGSFFNSPSCGFGNGSPIKRAIRRPRIDRSLSTGVLAEITQSGYNNKSISSAPLPRIVEASSPTAESMPSSVNDNTNSTASSISPIITTVTSNDGPKPYMASAARSAPLNSKLPTLLEYPNEAEWPSLTLEAQNYRANGGNNNANSNDNPALDILQGFQKIGAGALAMSKNNKPGLSRSYSSTL